MGYAHFQEKFTRNLFDGMAKFGKVRGRLRED